MRVGLCGFAPPRWVGVASCVASISSKRLRLATLAKLWLRTPLSTGASSSARGATMSGGLHPLSSWVLVTDGRCDYRSESGDEGCNYASRHPP
jgi:hypothetical protein